MTAKSEQIERLIIENKEAIATKEEESEKLIATIGKIKQEHANELREIERKWKVAVKQRSDQLESKHEEEVNELTQEWQNERRVSIAYRVTFVILPTSQIPFDLFFHNFSFVSFYFYFILILLQNDEKTDDSPEVNYKPFLFSLVFCN